MAKVTSPTLKKYLDTKKKPTIVLGAVERYVLSQPREERSTEVLHPSEFTKPKWCPREGWFLLMGDTKVEDPPGLQLLSIFEEGHAIHEKWQRWLHGAGLLVSAETPVSYPKFRVKGNADGVLLVDEEHIVLEVKSIGMGTLRVYRFPVDGGLAQSFRRITRPFNDHIRQAMFYVWVLRHEIPDLHRVVFIYECKEDQAVREFVVEYDDDYIEVALDKLRQLFPNEDGDLVATPPACINDEKCVCRRY